MVTPAVRAHVRAAARARGQTLRSLVLSALRDAGVLDGFSDTEFADRRATVAAAKAQLWREHRTTAPGTAAAPSASLPIVRKPRGGVT